MLNALFFSETEAIEYIHPQITQVTGIRPQIGASPSGIGAMGIGALANTSWQT